jgi:hypothetical protein
MSALQFKPPQCPVCCNKNTYVMLMEPLASTNADEYFCDCGKCGLRYRAVLERHVWLTLEIEADQVLIPQAMAA